MDNKQKHPSIKIPLIAYLALLSGVLIYKFILPIPFYSPYYLGGSRFIPLIIVLTAIFYIVAFKSKKVKTLIREFFDATGHPMTLAIFRIVFFYTALSGFDLDNALLYSRLPKELMFPPFGAGWFISAIPINEFWVSMAGNLFKVFCWFAIFGFCTRFSAIATLILFFYAGAIPQLFGKVNHYHNILWFNAILAFSPCADYLSVDAVIKAFRRADNGTVASPKPSQAYSLPLRLIWLLYGLAYFWPGFWKVWNDGTGWVLGDSLRNHMYSKWMDFPGWMPGIRIDQYPLLCKLGGVGTIAFELGFIFLLFFPVWRWLAIGSGFSFHLLTNFFMRIDFTQMRDLYVVFLPLDRIFRYLGKLLFPKEMTVFFDGNCKLCRRTIASLRVFDVFERVRFLNALASETHPELKAAGIAEETALKDMCAVADGRVYKGFESYRILVFRFPVLWPVLPFLFLWPVTALGRIIYRKIADSRKCQIPLKSDASVIPSQASSLALILTASVIFISNSFCGVANIIKGWPFACYPTFAHKQSMEHGMLEFEVVDEEGKVFSLQNTDISEKFSPERYKALVSGILYTDRARRENRLEKLWEAVVKEWPELSSVRAVRFYDVRESKIPEEKHLNPLSRELIYALQFK